MKSIVLMAVTAAAGSMMSAACGDSARSATSCAPPLAYVKYGHQRLALGSCASTGITGRAAISVPVGTQIRVVKGTPSVAWPGLESSSPNVLSVVTGVSGPSVVGVFTAMESGSAEVQAPPNSLPPCLGQAGLSDPSLCRADEPQIVVRVLVI